MARELHPPADPRGSPAHPAPADGPPKLLDQLRFTLRRRHYSIHTEDAYVNWCRRFILFHDKRHPAEMGEAEIRQFLTHLAVERGVAASTQNQALNAVVFLYTHVLDRDLGAFGAVERAAGPERLPVVLTRAGSSTREGGWTSLTRLAAGPPRVRARRPNS